MKKYEGEGQEAFDVAFEACAKMGPAFPVITKSNPDEREAFNIAWGLTKRELFAAMAMQSSMISCALVNKFPGSPKDHATDAVEAADALLAELEKGRAGK